MKLANYYESGNSIVVERYCDGEFEGKLIYEGKKRRDSFLNSLKELGYTVEKIDPPLNPVVDI